MTARPCAYRELNPAVLMMKSAEYRLSSELAEPMDRPMAQRILIQGQMRSNSVVIAGVGCKDPAGLVTLLNEKREKAACCRGCAS
jgi:hypothetical protein